MYKMILIYIFGFLARRGLMLVNGRDSGRVREVRNGRRVEMTAVVGI